MEIKRKAAGAGALTDGEERASKRRRIPAESDSTKNESPEKTTENGMAFLEQIRRTADKNGRLVAGYFEKLPPKKGNAEYYKQTRLPISLEIVEAKLQNLEFQNMSELEGYFKRMVLNAKEFYPRNSTIFEDAERVRKALSNYMTKANPAYQTRGYTAVPTPLPDEDDEDDEEEVEEPEADAEGEGEGDEEGEDNDGEGEEEEAGEEDEEQDGDEEVDEDEDEDEDGDGEEDDDDAPVVTNRRGPGRPPKDPAKHAQKMAAKAAQQAKLDSQFENVPYKGLTFQQAQEKIVEELLRKRDDEFDGEYFLPFVNLPPRSLRDYYKIISEPISIKKLQRIVRGGQSRADAGGQTMLKSWSAFEDKAGLLWRNAYYYNEEGSDIYELAKELEEFFGAQLQEARAVVPEPPQPKIKLKVQSSTDTPTPSGKRITIHVGGRGNSTESATPMNGHANNDQKHTGTPARNGNLEKTRSASAAVISPSPSAVEKKMEEGDVSTPGVMTRAASAVQNADLATEGPALENGTEVAVEPPTPEPPQPVGPIMWDKMFRQPGKTRADALIYQVALQNWPSCNFRVGLHADDRYAHQSTTINIPPGPIQNARIDLNLSPKLETEQRQYKLFVIVNGRILSPLNNVSRPHWTFEASLVLGLNVIEVQVCAAVTVEERGVGKPDAELEVFKIHANVLPWLRV